MNKTIILIGFLAFALGIGIAQLYWSKTASAPGNSDDGFTTVEMAAGGFGGDFTLYQGAGDKPVSLSDFKDKIVVMYFGFASCPDVCPTTLAVISAALKQLSQEEMQAVQPIFISIDPERDRGEKLDAYASYFHADFIGLTGTPEEVQKVANNYGGFFVKVDSDSAMDYLVEHTSKTYVISKGTRFVSILPHDMSSEMVLRAIRKAL